MTAPDSDACLTTPTARHAAAAECRCLLAGIDVPVSLPHLDRPADDVRPIRPDGIGYAPRLMSLFSGGGRSPSVASRSATRFVMCATTCSAVP